MMIESKKISSRAGVSLVTVLLFMLVATIAATATYKWLTSEGRSSGSRLQKKEAMAYAAAGIDNARAWMTFHGNDVGDLIRQYKPEGKPIEITARLRSLQGAGQNYRVWLTGVNTHGSTYKLKILATGESRNDTKHSEAAIFNVDGLYRVTIPIKKSNAPFEEAFHGDLKTFDVLDIDKAVITQTPDVKNNGGQAANDVTVADYLVMDGSFYVNNTSSIKDLYVTGGVGSCSGINVTNNLYVGGVFYPGNTNSTITGSLYTEGGINLKDTYPYTAITGGCSSAAIGNAEIGGNITSNGPFIYYDHNGTASFLGKGSMVLNSKIVFPTTNVTATVKETVQIEHNVYVKETSEGKMKDNKSVNCGMVPWQYPLNDPSDAIKRTKFGSGNDDKIWLKDFSHYKENAPGGPEGYDPCSEYYDTPWNYKCKKEGFTCAKTPVLSYPPYYSAPTSSNIWIGYKGTFLASEPSAEDIETWNADKMTKYEDKLKERDEACGNKIKTPIQLNREIFSAGYTHSSATPRGCNAAIWTQWTNTSALMNGCYQTAKENGNLYDGKWLIMEFDGPIQWSSGNMGATLTGYFIIKINANSVSNQLPLPPTGESSMVLLYLPNGWPNTEQGQNIEFASKTSVNRYFVFSEGDIGRFDMMGLNPPMKGSVVMANCSQLNTEGSNNRMIVRYDEVLTSDLFDASVICSNDGTNSCDPDPNPDPGDENEENGDGEGRLDSYYISMAPQLGVTLETRYESSETISTAAGATATLSPGFLILPRVIYLPEDPYGKLRDYYGIIPLNGAENNANLKKENLDVSCTSGGNALKTGYDELLYEEGHALAKGIYTCEAEASDYGKVKFWVKVGDAERGQPGVSFVSDSYKIGKTASNVEVKVDVPPHESAITLRAYCPDVPDADHWNYSVNNGNRNGDTKECTFEIGANTSDHETITLFSVSTTDAENGTLVFRLLEDTNTPTKYKLKSPDYTEVHVSSTVTLTREEVTEIDLDDFCKNGSFECPENYKGYWPSMDCDDVEKTGVWVVPSTGLSGTTIPNKEWAIVIGGTAEISLTDVNENEDCLVIIANETRNTAGVTDGGSLEPLRGSIKAKKKTLRVGFTGDAGSGKNPSIKVTAPDRSNTDLGTCSYESPSGTDGNIKYCEYDVFVGEKVSFEVLDSDDDNFNYWKCAGSACPAGTEPLPNRVVENVRISNSFDYYYLAHFGESDKHCFFDEFKEGDALEYNRVNRLSLECSAGKEYCINDCGGVCLSATTGSYKWNLLSGSMGSNGDLMYNPDYGYLSIKSSVNKGKNNSERRGVVVMSTVNAGINGTMKALVQIPKASSHGKESKNIRNSGFILRSNADASQYLMLNIYVNSEGHLEAQVCKNSDTDCVSHVLENNGMASVSVSSMVMVSAELRDNDLIVSAFKDNYYGSPIAYTHTFDVSGLSYKDRSHEYVGFSLADQNFKIHGIGWKSVDYNATCWDTYPSVKCSFAAVAKGGIIETNKNVEPWVGYSGWFSSTACEKKYYYYYGSDACYNPGKGEHQDCGGSYKFSPGNDEGAHGYKDAGGYDVKTAKAWLQCNSSGSVNADWWANAPESEYAHCGYFWTGEYKECANNLDLFTDRSVDVGETYITFEKANLRQATLNISISGENTEGLEIWLESKNEDGWGMGEPFQSQSFTITGTGGSYKVAEVIAGDSLGFNPEKVTGMKIKNYGTSSVSMTVKSMCDNSIEITKCSATYNSGLWTVSVVIDPQDNRKNVQTTEYKATVDGVAQFDFTGFGGSGNCHQSTSSPGVIECDQADDPYKNINNQGKKYVFWARVTGNSGESHDEKQCEETQPIGSIKLSKCDVESESAYPGEGYPQFQVNFDGCPSSGCKYIIRLDNQDITSDLGLSGNTSVDGTQLRVTASGNGESSPETVGASHTYRIENNDGPAFTTTGCNGSFEIKKKPASPVTVACNIENQTEATLGTSESRTIPAGQVTVTNCGEGECTYTIAREGQTGSSNAYVSGAAYTFSDVVNEAGEYKYTFTVTRTADGSTASCQNKFKVQYPLGGTCPVDKTDDEQDPAGVSIEPNITGCGSSCSYTITGGAITDCNGACTGYDGDDPISFKHPGATDTKRYTLTVSHDGAESKACEFNVKYPTGGGGGVSATCNVTDNNGGSGLYEGQKIQLRVSDISGINNNVNMVWTFNGSTKTIDCGTSGCWNNEIDAPTSGTYSYSLSYNGNPVSGCSGNVTIAPALTCSVSPTTVNQGESYTFKGADNVNCWSCTYTWDNGSEGNHNPTDEITKTASAAGTKNLTLSCSCNNNLTGTCTTPITINGVSSGSGGGTIAVGNSGVSITAGTHQVTCSGGGQLICWRSGDEFTFTLAGNDCKAFAGEGWGSCGGGTCKSTAQTIVTSKDMYCKGGW